MPRSTEVTAPRVVAFNTTLLVAGLVVVALLLSDTPETPVAPTPTTAPTVQPPVTVLVPVPADTTWPLPPWPTSTVATDPPATSTTTSTTTDPPTTTTLRCGIDNPFNGCLVP